MAADPGTMAALSITGNFTNPQYVNTSIDCTGLTFTIEYSSAPSSTISGDSFINGTYSYSIYGTTITIVANPSLLSTTGEQNVVFNASQTLTLAEATATKSVTVQSLSTTKNIYVFTNDGRRAIWGTIEEAPPVTVSGVTTNIVFKAQSQKSGRFNISYSDGTASIVYPYSVNTATRIITYTAETPPGTFTYSHYEMIGANYQALYYDYTEDGTTISDILMAVAGGGDN